MWIAPQTYKLWALTGHAIIDNVDYNDVKALIKLRTTHGQGQAKDIPGSSNEFKRLQAFEEELYRELREQHQRIDLFVQSKSGEIARRIGKKSSLAGGRPNLTSYGNSTFR